MRYDITITVVLRGEEQRVNLTLNRAPLFLRFVWKRVGHGYEWDALDQLDDEPRFGESVVVGVFDSWFGGPFHLKGQGSITGWYRRALYVVAPVQPEFAEARNRAKWRRWCYSQQAELGKAIPK